MYENNLFVNEYKKSNKKNANDLTSLIVQMPLNVERIAFKFIKKNNTHLFLWLPS